LPRFRRQIPRAGRAPTAFPYLRPQARRRQQESESSQEEDSESEEEEELVYVPRKKKRGPPAERKYAMPKKLKVPKKNRK
jgi:hypothetical protein